MPGRAGDVLLCAALTLLMLCCCVRQMSTFVVCGMWSGVCGPVHVVWGPGHGVRGLGSAVCSLVSGMGSGGWGLVGLGLVSGWAPLGRVWLVCHHVGTMMPYRCGGWVARDLFPICWVSRMVTIGWSTCAVIPNLRVQPL